MQLATIEGIKLESRISSNNRNLGQRMAFNASGTPAQMREVYKSRGLKGNALSSAVREAVKGGKDIAWVSFHALSQMAQNGDFIPTMGDINAKGTKIKLELVKPTEPKGKAKAALPAPAPTQAQIDDAAVKLLADLLGVTPEEAHAQMAAAKAAKEAAK